MQAAIAVENLSKRYRVDHLEKRERYKTLRDTLADVAKAPLRLFGRGGSSHSVEDFWALKDVSFEVKPGEVVGIIGRNGAGKSTLLKVLSRITEPSSGYADVYGRVGSLLEVGTGFHNELSGRDNIYLNGSILGMSRSEIRGKFDEIVAFSECERFLDTPVKRYSSGMYMRLAFAVAAHLEPEILVVDEVLAVGDAAFQRKCLGKMNEVAGHGRTVLFVSHNMAAVQGLCSRAIRLDGGRVVGDGSADQIVGDYLRAASAASGAAALRDRTDRTGDGSVRLVSLDIAAADGEPAIRTGGRLRVTIGYESDRDLAAAGFQVTVHDAGGTPLYVLSSDYAGGVPERLPARGAVTCLTEPIHLTPGRCYVNAEVFKGPAEADVVEHAAEFDVEPADFFGTGKLPDRGWVMCVVGQQWARGDGDAAAGEVDR
jgi:lipopolysaccharide transport system ATP-binding protein